MLIVLRVRAALRAIVFCLCLPLATAAHADLVVGAGGNMSMGSGAMDLGCTDITIAGSATLHLDSAAITGVRNVTIQPGGLLDFGSGSLALAGDFINNGSVSNSHPGAIIAVNNPSCAIPTRGPATPIPTLGAAALALLALLLAAGGTLAIRQRIQPINAKE